MRDMTAAPIEITLRDKTYTMHPLTDRDYGELDNWVRLRALVLARMSLRGAPTDEGNALWKSALEHVQSLSWIGALDTGILQSIDAIAQLVWVSIRKVVGYDDVLSAMYDQRTLDSAIAALHVLQPPEEEDPKGKKAERGQPPAQKSTGR